MVGFWGRNGLSLHTLSTRFPLTPTMAMVAFDSACREVSQHQPLPLDASPCHIFQTTLKTHAQLHHYSTYSHYLQILVMSQCPHDLLLLIPMFTTVTETGNIIYTTLASHSSRVGVAGSPAFINVQS